MGSNGFETLMAYEVENGVFALLQELGHRVVVQTVIAGGPDADEPQRLTLAELHARRAQLKMGGERKPLLAPHEDSRSQDLLEKPFTPSAVLERVRRQLDISDMPGSAVDPAPAGDSVA